MSRYQTKPEPLKPLISQGEFEAIVREGNARPDRLTQWEQGFLVSMTDCLRRNGATASSTVTDRQLVILRRMEVRLFDVG